MNIERVAYTTEDSEKILQEACDCLWVSFLGRKTVGPLGSRSLQCVDWKMSGLISRYVQQGKFRSKQTTFIPTMQKIPALYIALESNGNPDWELFLQNCSGLKWKKVVFFCEDKNTAKQFEKELSKLPAQAYPEAVLLASDE